ncbi:MAG: hypothetical protein K8W52_24005 [Deltaproteobacteria bacterium]|nr:hypothetical protein [Deltaproteobacteria bacterium]
MNTALPRPSSPAVLEPLRFGEFLRERHLITDEQWLAALATHWSERRTRIGQTLVDQGVLSQDVIDAEARAYHDDIAVVELAIAEPDTRVTRVVDITWERDGRDPGRAAARRPMA